MSSRLEWRNGQWQKSRIALKDPFNALLSILLRIFYDSKSEWLMSMVERGMDTIQLAESDERTEVWLRSFINLKGLFLTIYYSELTNHNVLEDKG